MRIDRYRDAMSRISPSKELDERVMAAVRKTRTTDTTSSRRATRRDDTFGWHPHRVRRLVLAGVACAVIAVLAVMVPALLQTDPLSQTDSSTTDTNGFGLAIASAAEPGNAADVSSTEDGIRVVGNTEDTEIILGLGLRCDGMNLTSVTYRLTGDPVDAGDIQCLESSDPMGVGGYYHYDSTNEFTIAVPSEGDSGDLVGYMYQQAILIKAPPEGGSQWQSLLESFNHGMGYTLSDEERAEKNRATAESQGEALLRAATKLEQCTLELTATFSDGTTQTKRYRISPVEDIVQVYVDKRELTDEHIAGEIDDEAETADPRYSAPLFTVTEITE